MSSNVCAKNSKIIDDLYYFLIQATQNSLKLVAVDARTEELVSTFVIKKELKSIGKCLEQFFMDVKIKAAILQVFGFQNSEFQSNAAFCQTLKDFCVASKTPFYFISAYDWIISSLLVAAEITVNPAQKILCIFISGSQLDVAGYEFTVNGYRKYFERRICAINSRDPSAVKDEIFGAEKPTKIIATSMDFQNLPIQILKNVLQDFKNFTFVDLFKLAETPKTIVKLSKGILNSGNNQFYILPTSIHEYSMIGKINDKVCGRQVIPKYAKLPYEMVLESGKNVLDYFVTFSENGIVKNQVLPNPPKNCHRIKRIITIDENNFLKYELREAMIPEIVNLPKILQHFGNSESKIPVIAFFDNISVICVYDESAKHYKFLNEWNGVYGKELFISFAEETVKFCGFKPVELLKTKPASVVYDFLHLIFLAVQASPSVLPQWNFKIGKNNGTFFIAVEDCNGRSVSVSLMHFIKLLFIRHLVAIEVETGKKPKELGIFFVNVPEEGCKEAHEFLSNVFKMLDVKMHSYPPVLKKSE